MQAVNTFLDVNMSRLREGHKIYSVEHDDIFIVTSHNIDMRYVQLSNNCRYIYDIGDSSSGILTSDLGLFLVPTPQFCDI